MQPKENTSDYHKNLHAGVFWGAESKSDVSFDLRPPASSGTRVLHGAVPRVRDPDATKGKPPPITTKIYTRGFVWGAEQP